MDSSDIVASIAQRAVADGAGLEESQAALVRVRNTILDAEDAMEIATEGVSVRERVAGILGNDLTLHILADIPDNANEERIGWRLKDVRDALTTLIGNASKQINAQRSLKTPSKELQRRRVVLPPADLALLTETGMDDRCRKAMKKLDQIFHASQAADSMKREACVSAVELATMIIANPRLVGTLGWIEKKNGRSFATIAEDVLRANSDGDHQGLFENARYFYKAAVFASERTMNEQMRNLPPYPPEAA